MRGEEVKKEIKTGERYHMEHGIIPFRRKSNKNEDENVDFVEEQKAHPYWWYYYRYAVYRECVCEWSVNMQRETNFRSRVKTHVDVKINAAKTKEKNKKHTEEDTTPIGNNNIKLKRNQRNAKSAIFILHITLTRT